MSATKVTAGLSVAGLFTWGLLMSWRGRPLLNRPLLNRPLLNRRLHTGSSMADVLAEQEAAAPDPEPVSGDERAVLSLDGYRAARRRAEVVDVDPAGDEIAQAARRAVSAARLVPPTRPQPSAAAATGAATPAAPAPGPSHADERAAEGEPGENAPSATTAGATR